MNNTKTQSKNTNEENNQQNDIYEGTEFVDGHDAWAKLRAKRGYKNTACFL